MGQYKENDSLYKYELFGVVVHEGTIDGGHYIAYTKRAQKNGRDQWYYFSDEQHH